MPFELRPQRTGTQGDRIWVPGLTQEASEPQNSSVYGGNKAVGGDVYDTISSQLQATSAGEPRPKGGNKAGGSDVDGKIQNQHDLDDSERKYSNNLRTKHP
ncbi:hypothetical protein K443DRAFT_2216 [Laccaria amethystina LaAM-08-1]|uniref:Uncharacterized protein n=1 Tax=Laccaria amethystina LaAM-08-1 TaxID=1095629 RepID=A0A0C9XRN8_9AGAR|nr:hypothetical protein K443DRAFT_2216 [Laccaria amethystina LaAM-08-1]